MGGELRTAERPGHGVEIVKAEAPHVVDVADRMRLADRVECLLAADCAPEEALVIGLGYSSIALAAVLNGRAEAIFGVAASEVAGRGSIWLLGTDECTSHGLTLTRAGRLWLPALAVGWQELGNYVHAENIVHCRWLEALGFKAVRLVEDFGPYKTPFQEYVLPCASPP